jgi:cytochrome c2
MRAQQPADFFRQNCMSCHTIGGGRVTGPDLKDVTQRKERAWLTQFLQNPKAMIDSGDPYALQLQQEAKGVIMPTIPGMTSAQARELLDFIEAESKLPKSQFAGLTISDRPFTAADVAVGKNLFWGIRPLAKGGPACASCHTLGTAVGLGGGRLGPDLTRVYERLGGRKAVGTWLSAPDTPAMQAVFRRHPLQPDEILPLLALVEDAAKNGRPADFKSQLNFFLIGFGGMGLGLVALGFMWRERFRAVRRPLVRGRERGEQ